MATHDYVIDNSTGANVRADLNLVLQAILSNNSSSSAPSTTAAYMWWADTTNGILKIRNSANNAWVELLQLDGTLTLEDGSVSTPALAFRDDLNTGIFSSAADTFNVATGGVERMELGATTIFNEDGADVDFRIEGDSDANLFFVDAGNNNIGIGTSSPDSNGSSYTTLTLNNSVNGGVLSFSQSDTRKALLYNDSSTGDLIIQAESSRSLRFATNGNNERMRIDSSGNVGIGTTSPEERLDLGNDVQMNLKIGGRCYIGQAYSTAATILGHSVKAKTTGTTSGGMIVTETNSGGGAPSALRMQSGNIEFHTAASGTADADFNSNERMRIDSSGRVGIGTTSPSYKNQISVVDTTAYSASTISANQFQLAITNTGAAGVAGLLFVTEPSSGNGGHCGIRALSTGSGDSALTFSTRGSNTQAERLRIDSSGNVLVNLTSATAGSLTYKTIISDSIGSGEQLLGLQYLGTVTYGINAESDSSLTIKKDGTERMRIASSGQILMGTTSNNGINSKLAISADGVPSYYTNPAGLSVNVTNSNDAHCVEFFQGRYNKRCLTESHSNTGSVTFTTYAQGGVAVGSITGNGSNTAFNTSSDYRLKENIVNLTDGITRLKQLIPRRYNWIIDSANTLEDGFIAHEISTVLPQAVVGEKDAVEEDGSINPQQMDYSKLTPLLTAALQEAIIKIETLETKVAALEAA